MAHVVWFPTAQAAPESLGMNNGVRIQIKLMQKSMSDRPNISRCWGLLRLKGLRDTCEMIMRDPVADRKQEIFWRKKRAMSYELVMLAR